MPSFTLFAFTLMDWVTRLGAFGFIPLGIADNSVVPMPGSMDVLVILLTAQNRHLWWFYAAMSTIGSMMGGYITYKLAEKGGEETLEKKIGKKRAEKVYQRFEKSGGITVFVGAILPPPTPIVPFLTAAGALQYPRRKFLIALGAGRMVRFSAVGWVAHLYGDAIMGWLTRYYKPILFILLGLLALGVAGLLLYLKWYRPKQQREMKEKHPEKWAAQQKQEKRDEEKSRRAQPHPKVDVKKDRKRA